MKIIVPALLIFVLQASFAIDSFESHDFTATVSKVRLSSQLVADGKDREALVTVSTQAVIFESPLIITDFRLAPKHTDPFVNRVLQYHQAIVSQTSTELAQFWHPDERATKLKMMSDPATFNSIKEYYSTNPRLIILGVIDQGTTASILIDMGGFVIGLNIIESDGDLLLTDFPADDLELAIIEASFVQ